MNIYRIISVAAAAVLTVSVSGQNLDPTVEVSRSYEGKLMEVHKPQLKMAVPDSVLRFDLEFDYSVSDSPYKGAYEFSPYTLDMKPSPTFRDVNSFYLKAGAGYQLHPVFDLIWSPSFKGPFRMNVYASHRSFVGKYWSMTGPGSLEDPVVIDRKGKDASGERSWSGYDLWSNAGVEGRYDWTNSLLGFDVGYEGIHQQDEKYYVSGRAYDSANARLLLVSKNHPDIPVRYHADLSYRFAADRYASSSEYHINENVIRLDGGTGYSLSDGDWFGLKIGFGMCAVDGFVSAGAGDIDLVPHYVIDRGRWLFDLGVRFSSSFRNETLLNMYEHKEQMIYPDVRIEYKAIPDALKVYFDLGGDSEALSYSDLIARDRRTQIGYGRSVWNILDIVDERISAVLGFEGRIGRCFSYGLEGGYVNYGNALLDGLVEVGATQVSPAEWLPGLGYSSYDKAFVSLDWLLDAEHFRFDGEVDYAYCTNLSAETGKGLLLPAALTGDVAFRYDWKDRVLAGVDCEFSSARKGQGILVPGYADLGLEVEYVVNRKFSAWARGGNLLGMTVYKSLLYAEKGPYFTLGICLNL